MSKKRTLKELADIIWADIGAEAVRIAKTKGIFAMEKFVDMSMGKYRERWQQEDKPLSEEQTNLRTRIAEDMADRLKTGRSRFDVNPSQEDKPLPLSKEQIDLRAIIDVEMADRLKIGGSRDVNPSPIGFKGVWDTSPDIRLEFGSYEVFAAYLEAVKQGLAKIVGPGSKVIREQDARHRGA